MSPGWALGRFEFNYVMPAQAGIHDGDVAFDFNEVLVGFHTVVYLRACPLGRLSWMPACAGMT